MDIRKFKDVPEDWKLLHDICYGCGVDYMKDTYSYLRIPVYRSKYFCDIFDEKAFCFGIYNKSSIRIIGIAALSDTQRQGLGRLMLLYEKKRARRAGISRITLRTPKNSKGYLFWASQGAKIKKEVGEDWEMTLDF